MTIGQLIAEASEKNPKFKKQINHRLNKRKKAPEFDWLMKNLVTILGEDYVRSAAKAQIKVIKEIAGNEAGGGETGKID